MFTNDQISEIVTSQLHSLLWSEGEITNEEGEFTGEMWDDYYTAEDATPELVATLTAELQILGSGEMSYEMHDALNAYHDMFSDVFLSQFGHDLALTRNHHGAGFWGRGLGEAGDVLTDWAQGLGELSVFHGHDSSFPAWAGKFHAE